MAWRASSVQKSCFSDRPQGVSTSSPCDHTRAHVDAPSRCQAGFTHQWTCCGPASSPLTITPSVSSLCLLSLPPPHSTPHTPLHLTTSHTQSWRMSRVNNAVSIGEDADSEESRTNTGRTETLGFHSSEDGRDYTSDITKRCQLRRHVNKNKVDSDSTRIWLKQVGTAASHKPPNPFGKGPSLKTSSRLGISQSPPQCPLRRGAELECCSPPTPTS